MTAKAAFLQAVEEVVERCLIPVPSMPLMQLSEAMSPLNNDAVMDGAESADEMDALFDVLDAADRVEWSFWPDGEYGSREALVEPGTVQILADAFAAYREAEKTAILAAQTAEPVSTPTWESITPIIGVSAP